MHVITLTKETTINDIYLSLGERWPELNTSSMRLQYKAPNEKLYVSLIKNMDIELMVRLHFVSEVAVCKVLVTSISTLENRRR